MKPFFALTRALLVTAAVATLFASAAWAQGGLDLSWDNCGGNGVSLKTFSCASNTLSAVMVGSAVSGVALSQVTGEESVMTVQLNQPVLSPWWDLGNGGCRGSSGITMSMDFLAGPFGCSDAWQGAAFGTLQFDTPYGNTGKARIRTAGGIGGTIPVDAATEYEYFKVLLLGAKSTGTGSCAGCSDGACIVFDQIKLVQRAGAPGGDRTIGNTLVRSYVLWQPGGSTVSGGCPAATSSRPNTWGSVKTLYR